MKALNWTKMGMVVASTALVLMASRATAQQCCGDCGGDGTVTIDEIITTVNFALDGCPAACITEGDSGTVAPGAPPCCEGLVEIGCEVPAAAGNCEPCVGAFFCTKCGDGACGPGENTCNCPTDCVRFVDNGDGTVTDNGTGLMWEQKDDLGGIHDKEGIYTWSLGSAAGPTRDGTVFTTFLGTLNSGYSADGTTISGCFAGSCDWRLPTSAELQTILLEPFPCGTSPCIDPIFGPTKSSYYWSATTVADRPYFAWLVFFDDGSVVEEGSFKTRPAYVRAVRGGS